MSTMNVGEEAEPKGWASVGVEHHQAPPAHATASSDLELPLELQQQGWRKFWSKRENRPYFWNKLTGESLWEMPSGANATNATNAKTHFDPITDPLGICGPPPALLPPPPPPLPHQPPPPSPSPSPSPLTVAKRRASDEINGPQAKKFILAGPWDLDVPTNVIILERTPCGYVHSHPEVEAYRCTLLAKLRQCYQELCHSREAIDAPKDSFNRWMMERKVIDSGNNNLLLPAIGINKLPCQPQYDY